MLDKFKNLILTFLWLSVHFIYHIVTFTVEQVRWNLNNVFGNLISCLPAYSPHGQLQRVAQTMKKLRDDKRKTPRHLGIVLGKEPLRPLEALWRNVKSLFASGERKDDKPSKEDFKPVDVDLQMLAKVVCWAWIADIPVISLYDSNGIIKSDYKELMSFLHDEFSQNLQISSDHNQIPTIKLHNLSPPSKKKNGYTNGHRDEYLNLNGVTNGTSHHPQVLHISLLGKDDGKKAIVQSCKDLHKERKNVENYSIKSMHQSISQISESVVDKKLNAVVGAKFSSGDNEKDRNSDPDLLLVFGKVMSTSGFLPWHIRLTEIHWLPALKRTVISDFTSSMLKFADCQQRFGT